jgi:hypothetical protein
MSHTKEPWRIDPRAAMRIVASKDTTVASSACSGLAKDEWEDNARRIVACVNACAGIDTVQLEMLDVVSALDSLNKVRAQRDELLAAANNLHDVMGRYHTEQAFKRLMAVAEKIKTTTP